ncbi:MAG: hypothetical protein PHV74_14130 [Dehalococcoidia bacterium]|nr:hypothetical protein [Dehalococcoidia bacterium]
MKGSESAKAADWQVPPAQAKDIQEELGGGISMRDDIVKLKEEEII